MSTRRFDLKRQAADWERKQRLAFDERGYDPSAGKVAVEDALTEWLEQREGKVSQTTLDTDRYLLPTEGQLAGTSRREPVLPLWFRKLHVVKVNGSAIEKWQEASFADKVSFEFALGGALAIIGMRPTDDDDFTFRKAMSYALRDEVVQRLQAIARRTQTGN